MSAKIVLAKSGVRRPLTVPVALASVSAMLVSFAATLPVAAAPAPPADVLISAGILQSCAIEHGKAYCWGFSDNGGLGNGATTQSAVPVAVSARGVLAGKTLTQIGTGIDDACALDAAGAAYCWGDNTFGQLGDGGTTDSGVPVAVSTSGVLAGKTLTQITISDEDACALDTAAPRIAGATTPSVSSGTAAIPPPAFRSRSTPAACWQERLSPRSAAGATTPVPWTAPAPRIAGAPTITVRSAMTVPPTRAFRSRSVPAAYWLATP